MTNLGEGVAIGTLPPTKYAEEPRQPGNLVLTLKETSSGEVIKDVKVSIAGASSGEATTNAAGQCRFDGIAAGFYALTLTQDEFEMSPDRARFAIHPDQTLKLNIKVRRVLTTVVMKRIHVRGTLKAATGDKSELEYGHWWVEVDGSQSFGWWPASGVSIGGTFLGVPGVLNEMKGAGGTATRDPHHGDPGDEEFSPSVLNGKSAADIKKSIGDFASGFSGKYGSTWRWPGKYNCHNFQEQMMKDVGLSKSNSKNLK